VVVKKRRGGGGRVKELTGVVDINKFSVKVYKKEYRKHPLRHIGRRSAAYDYHNIRNVDSVLGYCAQRVLVSRQSTH